MSDDDIAKSMMQDIKAAYGVEEYTDEEPVPFGYEVCGLCGGQGGYYDEFRIWVPCDECNGGGYIEVDR